MARQKKPTSSSFRVEVPGDSEVELYAYAFDRRGALIGRAQVEKGAVSVPASAEELLAGRLVIAPDAGEDASLRRLERIGGYEPLIGLRELPGVIEIPPPIIDLWPFCLCFVKGGVVRPDGRPVCDARVHICEVDRIPWIIAELPEFEVLKLRDDLLDQLRRPPWPPEPFPDPRPGPFPGPDPGPRPGPDPAPEGPFRAVRRSAAMEATQPRLNPQPEVPGTAVSVVQPILLHRLQSNAVPVVRAALIENYRLILPWLCLWPWWWARFECDEVRIVDTGNDGRFQTIFFHDCSDQPDLYFWVEFDFGSGFETVHRPPIACNTHWDYTCGSEVTITVTDPRVPGCVPSPAVGCDVNVLSIGRQVSIREIENDAGGLATEGLTQTGEPFGGKLEPRVDFGPALIGKGIEFYRWSFQRLSGPNGTTGTVDASSTPIGVWTSVTRNVVRHYRETSGSTTSYPALLLGPLPTTEAPAPNLFRIPPELTPAGDHQWRVLDEREDLASAHFETTKLAGVPVNPGDVDLAAGRYELKLELFDSAGNLVNWTDEGITLGITDQNAPFGTSTVTTSPAPNYNRVLDTNGKTVGFRMVLRVDNNRCAAVINPVAGDITSDPTCGFHRYTTVNDDVELSFQASHPNGLATYDFDVVRGATTHIAPAETTGTVGAGGNDGFSHLGGSVYAKDVSVGTLIGSCPSAAFAETLRVLAMAQDGYTRLSGYDAFRSAGFALTPQPTPGGGPGRPPGPPTT